MKYSYHSMHLSFGVTMNSFANSTSTNVARFAHKTKFTPAVFSAKCKNGDNKHIGAKYARNENTVGLVVTMIEATLQTTHTQEHICAAYIDSYALLKKILLSGPHFGIYPRSCTCR
jgi:hypothetical protein